MDAIFFKGFADELEKIAKEATKAQVRAGRRRFTRNAVIAGIGGGALVGGLPGAAALGTVLGAGGYMAFPHLRDLERKRLKAEKTKHSSGLELAGLGMLAAPSAYHLATGKQLKEKTKSKWDLAGLGTLAGSTVKNMMKSKV